MVMLYMKWPGKVHDARVLSNSGLYREGQNGELFPNVSMTFCKIKNVVMS